MITGEGVDKTLKEYESALSKTNSYAVFVDTTNKKTGNQYISLWTVKASDDKTAMSMVKTKSLEIYKNTDVVIDNISAKKLEIYEGAHYYGTI